MPYTKLYATAGRSPQEKRALMEAVHRGLVEGAGIPEWDTQVRLLEFGPDNMLLPDSDDYASYLLIEVTGYPRSLDVKRDLFASLVKNLSTVGVDPKDTKIIYFDIQPDSWGVQGGRPGSDVAAEAAAGADTGWSAKY
jgi:phenylpyruvate tautomerase PptA (4-oxalocrotonate tautomerase family)